MSLQTLIDEYTQQLKHLQQQVGMSATAYTQKENDLKQHLAHHNNLLGELNATGKALEKMMKAKGAEVAPPVVPPAEGLAQEPEAE